MIYEQPAAPLGSTLQEFCLSEAATVANLNATGANIKWYDAATGGNEVLATTPLVNGTIYYASQKLTLCESSARLAVTASIQDCHPTECNDLAAVSGTVKNGATPLANVPVVLVPQGDAGSTTDGAIMKITGADGSYRFDNILPGNYLVQVLDANLNSARNLFNVNSSLFFVTLKTCDNIVHNYTYGAATTPVIGDFVWLDINNNQLQDEWFDANDDNKVTKNIPDANGSINLNKWEWIDLNNDGSYDGPQNEGELNRCGFGQNITSNVLVTGPNGFSVKVIVSIDGHWRTRPKEVGEYQAELIMDQSLADAAAKLFETGLCKVLSSATKIASINSNLVAAAGNKLVYDWMASIGTVKGSVTAEKLYNFGLDLAVYGKAINKPPVVTDQSRTIEQNQTLALTASDFESKFEDPDLNDLIRIKIVSLPLNGTLMLNDLVVRVDQVVQYADLGRLTFVPDNNYIGETSFKWNGSDGADYAVNPAFFYITITPPEVKIPQGFSPNGDGINDNFVIEGAEKYIVTLRIFNRWNNKVYESTHYQNDWDGSSNVGLYVSNLLPGGTYFYTVDFNNGEKPKVGYLTLKR
jgi:gliding motility-associated-like protein